jgi:acetylornithine deacetylase/succinyl-diaminopimelate desuccinylase-like protein
MLRVLEENRIDTEGPVGVVNWTNEEGARFPMSMMGSGVWCGQIPLDKAHNTLEIGDPQGGRKSWKSGIQIGGHFELHIEQGPHLTSGKQKIGVVEGAQAYQWFTITIEGRDCHSGHYVFEPPSGRFIQRSATDHSSQKDCQAPWRPRNSWYYQG